MERDNFQRLERNLSKVFMTTSTIFLAPNIFAFFGFLFLDNTAFAIFVSIYFMSLYAMAIMIYQSSGIQFIVELYKYHRLAF